jgi:glycosyltransferase involved in cell wall biosynthesis
MKKIAVIIKNTTYHKYFGGLETHTKNLLESLSEDYEITVFSPKRELKNFEIKDGNIKYYFLDAKYKTSFWADLFKSNWYQTLLGFFREINKNENFDLVISISSAGYPIILNKKKLKDEFKFKILTISHGTAGSEFQSLINEKISLPRLLLNFPYVFYNILFKQRSFILGSDMVVCVSDYVKNELIKETGDKNVNKFLTIFNGSRHEEYIKDFEKNGKLVLLFAGRVEKSKGVWEIIQSISDLDVVLKIAGDGSLIEELKKYIQENKLEEKILLLGKLKYSDLVNFYKEADLLVSPSLRVEGFPMSIVEAMGYYLPIITTNIGGNKDAVVDSKNGFLISMGDVIELRDKINYFNKYPEKIKEFGLNSRNFAIQKYSFDVMLSRYKKIINDLIK